MKKLVLFSFVSFILFSLTNCKSTQVTGDQKKCPPNKYAKMPGYRAFTVADKTFHDGYLNKIEYIPSANIGFKITKTTPGAKKYVDGVYVEEKKQEVTSVALCAGTSGVFYGEQDGLLLILWAEDEGEEIILAWKPSAYSSTKEYKFYGYYDKETQKVTFIKLGAITLNWVAQHEVDSKEKQKNLKETTIQGETIREN
ncbi:hypothetical protein H6776_00515 [Candidatus Nomurabacteria bacterium]|nr:hypothetical protein [Candidatus Nomurabacteria bacterium]